MITLRGVEKSFGAQTLLEGASSKSITATAWRSSARTAPGNPLCSK
ncbi:MAG: hypothetical protein LHV69_05700 [Elusimicrobia bacterium]|nr:hypothetical protein [Candidatus Obscuribacterium magneticum]